MRACEKLFEFWQPKNMKYCNHCGSEATQKSQVSLNCICTFRCDILVHGLCAWRIMMKATQCGFADEVSRLCLAHYHQHLPKRGKPQSGKEWTLLAAVLKADNSGRSWNWGPLGSSLCLSHRVAALVSCEADKYVYQNYTHKWFCDFVAI